MIVKLPRGLVGVEIGHFDEHLVVRVVWLSDMQQRWYDDRRVSERLYSVLTVVIIHVLIFTAAGNKWIATHGTVSNKALLVAAQNGIAVSGGDRPLLLC